MIRLGHIHPLMLQLYNIPRCYQFQNSNPESVLERIFLQSNVEHLTLMVVVLLNMCNWFTQPRLEAFLLQTFPMETQQPAMKIIQILNESGVTKTDLQQAAIQCGLPMDISLKMTPSTLHQIAVIGSSLTA